MSSVKIEKVDHERGIVFNDTHFPFIDKRMVEMILAFVKFHKPDFICLNGDIIDMYSISRFLRKKKIELKDELASTIDFLRRLREVAPDSYIFYTQGNHEERLEKFIFGQAPALNLEEIQIENLLKLEEFKIDYFREGSYYYKGMLYIHGSLIRKYGGYTANGNLDKYCSGKRKAVICGHVHRIGRSDRTVIDTTYESYENGCLCYLEQEYVEMLRLRKVGKAGTATRGATNWQQGFAVVDVFQHRREWKNMVHLIKIWNNAFFFEGKKWSV